MVKKPKGCGKSLPNGTEAYFADEENEMYKKYEVAYEYDGEIGPSACGVEYPCSSSSWCCPTPYCEACMIEAGLIW